MTATRVRSVLKKAQKISLQKEKEQEARKKQKEQKRIQGSLKRWEEKFLRLPTVRRGIENMKYPHLQDPEKTIFSVLEVTLLKIGSVSSNIIIYDDETVEIILCRLNILDIGLNKKEKVWLKTAESPLKIDFNILFSEDSKEGESVDDMFVISFDSKGGKGLKRAFRILLSYFDWVSENPALPNLK